MSVDSGSYDEATLSRRRIAQAMASGYLKPEEKVTHWAQGLANVAKAGIGGYLGYQADEEQKADQYKQNAELYKAAGLPPPEAPKSSPSIFDRMASAMGGGDAAPVPPASPAAAPPMASPDAVSPIPPQAPIAPQNTGAVVGPNDPSPLDNAPYPAGPMGAPGSSQPRGIRNNNPLNIEAGGFTKSQPGFAGSDGRFAKFESQDQGVAAASKLLDTYETKYGLNTPAGIIGRWAPQGENNSSAYAATVAKKLGIGVNDPITAEMRPQLISAMAEVENGKGLSPGVGAIAQAMQPQPYQVAGPAVAAPQSASTAVPQAMAAPTLPQGTASGVFAGVPRDKLPALVAGLTSKNPTMKALAVQQLGNYTKADGPTDEIKEYNLDAAQRKANGQSPRSFFDFKTELKKAGATNVTTNVGKDEEAFDKEAGKIVANRYNDLAAEGPAAKQMVSDVQTLQQLGTQIGTGKGAQVKEAIGPYAQALGIDIKGLSDIQAYEAIVNRVAPTLRVKGSGAQSDMELKNFLKSLPTLGNTPEGNALVAKTMQGLAQNKVQAAQIGSDALNKEITRKEADKRLLALPDPMQEWRDSQKAAKPTVAKPAEAPKSGGASEGATATNPKTGERMIFEGGKWKPLA